MKYVVIGSSHAGYKTIQTLLKEGVNGEICLCYHVAFKATLKILHLH